MESREEIESMRVSDLREFLRRHGAVPAVVTRGDGTPGAPRKADLMRAALAIEHAARQGRPATVLADDPDLVAYSPPRHGAGGPTLQDDDDDYMPNPFQSKMPSPAAGTAKPQQKQHRRRSLAAASSAAAAPVAQSPAETLPPQQLPQPVGRTPERRKRRSSAAWIDPSILGALAAKTNLPKNTAVKNRKPTPARPTARAPARDEPILIDDDPPPPAPLVVERPASQRRTTPRAGRARRQQQQPADGPLRDLLFPEEDDYDADFNAADPRLANAFDDVDEFEHELVDEAQLFDESTLDEDRRDVLVSSDYDGADTRDAEGDSTVETDEDIVQDEFQSWDVMKLRRWLAKHKVRYARDSRKSELVSLARAHSLQMETAADNIVPELEEDVIRPTRRSTSARGQARSSRRRRIISAPADDDDNGEQPIDVDEIAAERSDANRRAKKRREKSRSAAENDNGRHVRFSSTYFVALVTVVLGTVCLWSAFTVYRSHSRPFCDTDDLTSYTAGGEECRKCPQYGKCFNGTMTCDAGFVSLGGKVCVEDQESSIFGEELANDAYALLSNLAGRAECGEIESGALSLSELKKALRLKHSEKPEGGLFQWGFREFDPSKFDFAFEKAVKRLQDDDFADVSISVFDEYRSNTPVMSLTCTAKLALRRNWHFVVACIVVLALFIYVKIYMYLRKVQQEELENAYRLALQYLREQKGGFVRSEEEFAFISDVVLRQEVLGHPTERVIKLWKKVEQLLRNDSRVAWSANRVVKGVPSNTFEWRSRVSKGGVFASGGSLRSLDSPAVSDGPAPSPAGMSWFDNARRRLFNAP